MLATPTLWQPRRGAWWRLPWRNPLELLAGHLQYGSGTGHLKYNASSGHLSNDCLPLATCSYCSTILHKARVVLSGLSWTCASGCCSFISPSTVLYAYNHDSASVPDGTYDVAPAASCIFQQEFSFPGFKSYRDSFCSTGLSTIDTILVTVQFLSTSITVNARTVRNVSGGDWNPIFSGTVTGLSNPRDCTASQVCSNTLSSADPYNLTYGGTATVSMT